MRYQGKSRLLTGTGEGAGPSSLFLPPPELFSGSPFLVFPFFVQFVSIEWKVEVLLPSVTILCARRGAKGCDRIFCGDRGLMFCGGRCNHVSVGGRLLTADY
jgi:hypothetical protein